MTITVPDAPLRPDDTPPGGAAGDRIAWAAGAPFLLMHVVPLAAVFVTVTWQDWVLCALLFVGRMFCITAGYHRYFAHRSYRTNRVVAFLLALGATTAAQKGPLWWAGHHRIHHRYTDREGDIHSPREGFWWSHVGWILSTRHKDTDVDAIRDFAARPEIRWLDRLNGIPPWLLGIACLWWGGWGGLLIGFCLSTVLLWHATFLVNSAAHLFGRRRFATPDTSRNSFVVALLTLGEGWHNNHHYLPASARQGFAWWELDPTWYALRVLSWMRLVHDLHRPPVRLLQQARVRDGAFDVGMFRWYVERAVRSTGKVPSRLLAMAMAVGDGEGALHADDGSGVATAAVTGVVASGPAPTGSSSSGPGAADPVTAPALPEPAAASSAASSEGDGAPAGEVPSSGRVGSAEFRVLSRLVSESLASAERLARATRRTRGREVATTPDRS